MTDHSLDPAFGLLSIEDKRRALPASSNHGKTSECSLRELRNASDKDKVLKIRNHPLFDGKWYLSRYPDVALLGADPAQHFFTYGRVLERSPGPDFDTAFYILRYGDVGTENPLLHYLSAPERQSRPVNEKQLRAIKQELDKKTRSDWKLPMVHGARKGPPVISYCIPIMGRLDDLKGTLAKNLSAHATLVDDVEFLVVVFDDSPDTLNWILTNFSAAIDSGLLRVIQERGLDSWHFGKAKNAFRAHMLGEIYSSLDGDNFVTQSETRSLLAANLQYSGHFLFHHFSGKWGDGTSGRISLPAQIYREIGYDSAMLPRQYDEIDIILRALQNFPAMPLLCLDPERNLFSRSRFAHLFREAEKLPNRVIPITNPVVRPPLNPRGESYTEQSPYLRHMGNSNAWFSAYKATSDIRRKAGLLEKLTAEKHKLLDSFPREALLDTFFFSRSSIPSVSSSEIALFVVVKNEQRFLPAFIQHHRNLGVERFFVIDDGSQPSVETYLDAPDVHVFHPKVGNFSTFKTAWIEALMKFFLKEGAWVLTIDADEFIHLPDGVASFSQLARQLEEQEADFMPGLMLDLVPAPDFPIEQVAKSENDFLDIFTHCGNVESAVAPDYRKHASISWGFGPHADISWRVDLRYHAFGTVDSLRKIPFLRYQAGRHLNQGFHSLHHTDGRPQISHDIWERSTILSVFHYKLVRLFSQKAREQMLKEASNYHARTHANLLQIFGDTGSAAADKLLSLSSNVIPANEMKAWLSSVSAKR